MRDSSGDSGTTMLRFRPLNRNAGTRLHSAAEPTMCRKLRSEWAQCLPIATINTISQTCRFSGDDSHCGSPAGRNSLSSSIIMLDPSSIAAGLSRLPPQRLRATLETYLPQGASTAEKISAIENGLRSPLGQSIRDAMARWIVDEIVPVEKLVPKSYVNWRLPVRDAMMFVVARLSPVRLAPKLLEQIELPFDTPAELRLLRLIAKVPGLQKLGQVIARNQHLHPALRKALSRLENGIRDVRPEDIRSIVLKALGTKAKRYQVEVSTHILKEASVSAVIRFSWKNPQTGLRERGVFKVLK